MVINGDILSGKMSRLLWKMTFFTRVNQRFLCAIYTIANCNKLPEGNGRRDINNGIIPTNNPLYLMVLCWYDTI